MTLQEERAALQKRMDEIDKEIDAELSGFVPGWYVCWVEGNSHELLELIENKERHNKMIGLWENVKPFHLVADNYLPEGWRVVGPESKTLYDWRKAPEWANWAAMDEDGDVFWYEGKPKMFEGREYWSCTEEGSDEADENVKLRYVPWDQSLEQRPGITQ